MYREKFSITTNAQKEILDITGEIQKKLEESNTKEGFCSIFVLHTTCAVTTGDLDPGTDLDTLDFLDKITPRIKFRHPHNPSHVPDHILSSIIGDSLLIPVENGKLLLGTWQKIILIELDGPKERDVVVSIF